MATLLMIESWLQTTGRALPPLLTAMGHDYVLMTRDPALYGAGRAAAAHPALRLADDVVVVETNDLDAVATGAAALAARRTVDGVLTTCDYYLPAAAHVADRLALPGPSHQVVRRALRKDEVRSALDASGLPNARHRVVDAWPGALAAAAELGFPLVAKPVDLNAGVAVRRVDDDAHLKDAFAEITAGGCNTRGQRLAGVLLLEEVLVGTEVSVEALTVGGRTTVIGITDKSVTGPPAFVESGHMFPAALAPRLAAEVEAYVVDVVAAIGLDHGLTHSEVMITADGPRLVELNPRQGGGYIFDLVEAVTGTNPLRLLVDLAVGAEPAVGTATAPRPGTAAPGGSAAVVFVMSPTAGEVVGVTGTSPLAGDPAIHRWDLPVPARAVRPVDNEAYLGHLMVVDADGPDARRLAEAHVASLRLHLADGATVRPLGFPSGLVDPSPGTPPAGL